MFTHAIASTRATKAWRIHLRAHHHRHPELVREERLRLRHVRRRHADHLERMAVDPNRAADYRGVRPIAAAPQRIAQHDDRRRARRALLLRQEHRPRCARTRRTSK
jgi:hypothetical protein